MLNSRDEISTGMRWKIWHWNGRRVHTRYCGGAETDDLVSHQSCMQNAEQDGVFGWLLNVWWWSTTVIQMMYVQWVTGLLDVFLSIDATQRWHLVDHYFVVSFGAASPLLRVCRGVQRFLAEGLIGCTYVFCKLVSMNTTITPGCPEKCCTPGSFQVAGRA